MKVSIGILAHQEEASIGAMIATLGAQSLIAAVEAEIIVVANGCADRTAETARRALAGWRGGRVIELARAGKANAWNVFVHEASARDADYLILIDADVEFAETDALARLVRHLEDHPEILVAPDQPTKRFAAGGALQPLIRALQKSGSDDDHALSGQCYAARAAALRAVVMPTGLVVEDGFLRAMILTGNFSGPEDLARIRRAPGVRHFYRPYETLGAIWRYERRQAAGTAVNRFLYDEFRAWRAAGKEVAAEIDRRNRADPGWLDALVAARARAGGALLVPRNYVLRRWRRRRNWTARRLFASPLIAAAIAYDLLVALAATRQLRRRGAQWDAIRSAA
jgi:glycosyltransferase involved in cell wall biosynthesis